MFITERTMRFVLLLALTMSVLSVLSYSSHAQERHPIPSAAAQQQALELIKEVYGDEWEKTKTSAQKTALATKLLQKANESADPTNRYVLLKIARDVAAQAGDAELAFKAIDAMAARYDVDAYKLEGAALSQAAKSAKGRKHLGSIAEHALPLIDQAVEKDDFRGAKYLGKLTLDSARKARAREVLKQVVTRNGEVAEIAKAYEAARDAFAKLKEHPVDADANLAIGNYHCFLKGNWEKGIPMLALGSDKQLKKLAMKELAGAVDSEGHVALGDGWWELAEKEEGVKRSNLRKRIQHWYEKALPGLPPGLQKDKVKKRLSLLQGAKAPPVIASSKVITHVRTLQAYTKKKSCGVAFSPDGKVLASAGDNAIRLWTLGSHLAKASSFTLPDREKAFPISLAFTPDGETLAVSHFNGKVQLWDFSVRPPRLRKVLDQQKNNVPSIAISPNGRFLAGGGRLTGIVSVWDLRIGQVPEIARLEHDKRSFFSVSFSPDSKTLAVGVDKQLCVWDITKRPIVRRWTYLNMAKDAHCINFSPDGTKLVFADNTLIHVLNTKDLSRLGTLVGHTKHVVATEFTLDGKYLLSGGYDQSLRLWNIDLLTQAFVVENIDGVDESIEIAPNGRLIATCGTGNVVQLWRIADVPRSPKSASGIALNSLVHDGSDTQKKPAKRIARRRLPGKVKQYSFTDANEIKKDWDIAGKWRIENRSLKLASPAALRSKRKFKGDFVMEVRCISSRFTSFNVEMWGETFMLRPPTKTSGIVRFVRKDKKVMFAWHNAPEKAVEVTLKAGHLEESPVLMVVGGLGSTVTPSSVTIGAITIMGTEVEKETPRQ